MILGLDLGASTGWALISTEDAAYNDGGTRVHKIGSKDPKAKRWVEYRSWLMLVLDHYKPGLVAVEDVSRHVGVQAAHAYGFYRYCLDAECHVRSIPLLPLPVGKWKKISTGKGNSQKHEVAEAMLRRFPAIEHQSDDHSDAMGIAYAAWTLRDQVTA